MAEKSRGVPTEAEIVDRERKPVVSEPFVRRMPEPADDDRGPGPTKTPMDDCRAYTNNTDYAHMPPGCRTAHEVP